MKYCFKPNMEGQYPEMDESEFQGDGTTSGYVDFVCELVRDLRKRCFFDGYREGVKDAFADMGCQKEFTLESSDVGAERRWNESERVDVKH